MHQEKINLYNVANFDPLTQSNLAHYRIVCLYSINVCYDIFVSYGFFSFFKNIFNSEAVKIGYIIII